MKWEVTDVVYEGGEPRGEYYDDRIGEYTCGGVDFLLVKLGNGEGDEEELYAEHPYFPPLRTLTQDEVDDPSNENAHLFSNEDGESCIYDSDWYPSPSEEADALSELREAILQQAAEYGAEAVDAVGKALSRVAPERIG